MISSRHFAQNKENSLGGAAFARTPGTSKAAPGSVRGKALTTGKHPAFGDKVPMGDEHASIGV